VRHQVAIACSSEGEIGVVFEESNDSVGNHDARLLRL
jgi:hypothetical protein